MFLIQIALSWSYPKSFNIFFFFFYSFKAHSDCTNGISFNMPYSLLATSSGQRKIFKNNKKSKDPSSSSDSEGDDDADQTFENSLKIWKYC